MRVGCRGAFPMFSKSYPLRFQILAIAAFAVLAIFFYAPFAHAAALTTTNQANVSGTGCNGSLIKSISSIDTSQLPADYNAPGKYCIETDMSQTYNCTPGNFSDPTYTYSLYSTSAIVSSPGGGGTCSGTGGTRGFRTAIQKQRESGGSICGNLRCCWRWHWSYNLYHNPALLYHLFRTDRIALGGDDHQCRRERASHLEFESFSEWCHTRLV